MIQDISPGNISRWPRKRSTILGSTWYVCDPKTGALNKNGGRNGYLLRKGHRCWTIGIMAMNCIIVGLPPPDLERRLDIASERYGIDLQSNATIPPSDFVLSQQGNARNHPPNSLLSQRGGLDLKWMEEGWHSTPQRSLKNTTSRRVENINHEYYSAFRTGSRHPARVSIIIFLYLSPRSPLTAFFLPLRSMTGLYFHKTRSSYLRTI